VVAASRQTVQSVERAFDLMEALADGEELGVTELASRTGLVPSTAHRLLATLTRRGYVTQTTGSTRYALGYKVVEIANGREHGLARLRAVARPHLESVKRETGETVNLTALDGDRVVYIDQVEGSRSVRMFTTVGAAALAHTTASGKAILAHAPPEALDALFDGRPELERLTPRTLTTLEELRADIERTRRRGYAVDDEEHEEGVSCVAVAILDDAGQPSAAISISGPSARIVHAQTAELGELLTGHANDASAELGHRPNGDSAGPTHR
jgi:DNA-binding IclR family transcriptional regulator